MMLDMKVEIEKILKGSLDSISSPSVKIQIMGGKVYLWRRGKTRPVYFYLFGRNRMGIVQIVLGKVRKFRAAKSTVLNFRKILNICF